MKRYIFIFILVLVVTIFAFWHLYSNDNSPSCVVCHDGIESFSETHSMSCTQCHAGDSKSKDKNIAHKDMIGGKNPSAPKFLDKTCGKCHEYQLRRVKSTIMLTNVGIIKNTLIAWGDNDTTLYGTDNLSAYSKKGDSFDIRSAVSSKSIVADMYRKFCDGCHIASDEDNGYMTHHSSGCAACHMPYAPMGLYEGDDKALKNKRRYAKSHSLMKLPNDEACLACHNRSGRISLSYKGIYDGNNALTPTSNAIPGPDIISNVRTVRHTKDDIHHRAGMECIDCHTSNEIMGDGYTYENMFEQIEITCENCHGSYDRVPKTTFMDRENLSALIESKNYAKKINFGDEMVLTKKDRPFSNVVKENDKYFLYGKRNGIKREIKVITNSDEHKINRHKRLECYSCHSKVVIQCYGCHVLYDETKTMWDSSKQAETKGEFSETEDIRLYYPFPLAINERGKISPITPGCQTFITHVNENGTLIKNEFVPNFRGQKKLKFAPFYSHNTDKKAVSCKQCHENPFFYGFGDALFSSQDGILSSATTCDQCEKPLVALFSINKGVLDNSADIVRDNSRNFNKNELIKIVNANKCIICHTQSKYYAKEIDYEKTLNDNIHKPLLR